MEDLSTQVEGLWNGKRRELFRLLRGLNEGLAELYKRAIDELDLLPSDEMSAVTCSTVSYYGRELLNNLPDFLSIDGALPPRGQFQDLQAKALKRVVDLADATSLPNAVIEGQMVLVSGELAVSIRNLAKTYEKGSMSRQQRDSVIIVGQVQDDVAASMLLKEARDVLTGHQHANLTKAEGVVAKSDFVESFKIIEDLLLARLGSFFATVDELRESMRLVEAVGVAEESDVDAIVREVLLRLGDYQHRRFFYEGIRSPRWMRHLKNRGAFKVGVHDATNNGRFMRWPEGDYLVAMACTLPDDVLGVCLDAGKSCNPFVQAQVLSAAARLPGEKAMRLHKVVLRWIYNMRTMPYCFDQHDASQLVANLFKVSTSKRKLRKSEEMLKNLFLPDFKHGVQGAYHSRSEIVAAIPEYCYREELDFVVRESGGVCGYHQIRILLECYEHEFCESAHLEYGASSVRMNWRPSIASPGHPYPSNYGNHLVDVFVRVLREEAVRKPDCLAVCYQSKSSLISRSAIHILTELIVKRMPPSCGNMESLSIYDESIKSIAQGMLDDAELLYKGFDAETIALLQACMMRSAIFDLQMVMQFIGGYRQHQESIRASSLWLRDLAEGERNAIARRQATADEHLLLARVGKTALPQALATHLAELDAEYGELSNEDLNPFGPSSVASWGYSSPVTAEEMLQMPMDELSKFLCGWRPKNVYDEPSVMGLANALQQAVSHDAMHFVCLLRMIEDLSSIYVGALLRGMSDAIGGGREVPVDDLASTCFQVCTRVATGRFNESETAAAREEIHDCRYDAGDLAEKLALSEAALSAEGWEYLLETGLSLVEVREPLKEEQFVNSYPEDPVTVLINLLLPKGVEILACVAGNTSSKQARLEAEEAITSLLSLRQDARVFGALGMAFPLLFASSPQFAEEIASKIVLIETTDMLVAFVYPMLYSYRYNHEMLCVLKPIIRKTVLSMRVRDRDARGALSSKTMERIGFWLYVEREAGYASSNDSLFALWRSSASVEERREVLREICHRACYEDAPAAIVMCAMDYWDEVCEHENQVGETGELNGVFLLAHNPTVDDKWLAPRMVIEASKNDVTDSLAAVSGRLVDVARIMPSEAIAVLEFATISKTRDEDTVLPIKHLAQVLAYGCMSEDAEVVSRAKSLMDRFGRRGMIYLDERVRDAMKDIGRKSN